jgi:hypothetical protein
MGVEGGGVGDGVGELVTDAFGAEVLAVVGVEVPEDGEEVGTTVDLSREEGSIELELALPMRVELEGVPSDLVVDDDEGVSVRDDGGRSFGGEEDAGLS